MLHKHIAVFSMNEPHLGTTMTVTAESIGPAGAAVEEKQRELVADWCRQFAKIATLELAYIKSPRVKKREVQR